MFNEEFDIFNLQQVFARISNGLSNMIFFNPIKNSEVIGISETVREDDE